MWILFVSIQVSKAKECSYEKKHLIVPLFLFPLLRDYNFFPQPIPGQPMSADWTKFIQTVSTNPKSGQSHGGPPNINVGMGGSLPPQLSLPNRRGGQPTGQAWAGE